MADAVPGLKELAEALEELERRKTFRKLDFFIPYEKQQAFMDAGATKRERALLAGNQLGKTETGAAETAMHLTGEYPEGWMGRRWDRPVKGWAAGETGLLTRDVQQKKLMGEPGVPELLGTGYIPKENILDTSLARGVTDAYDTVVVKHTPTGGNSILRFKSYEQGRQKFQGETLDFAWLDEEPPEDVYNETLTRVTATRGMVFCTFTPLKGMSGVVMRYLNEESDDRFAITMVIEDALHIPADERAKIIAGYAAHERDARARGVPLLGSGRIFQFADEAIQEAPLEYIPPHWLKLWGVDFGIAHPFGGVLILWDRDNDVIHVHHAFRVSDQGPLQHAAAMKPIGAEVPVAWPQDGTQRDKGSLEPLAKQYKAHGLRMMPSHATFADGSNSTEAGIEEMRERMETGRFKVAAHLSDWFEEFRLYHRKDGLIVKLRDDLMSATRVAIMAKRFGRAVALGGASGTGRRRTTIADGVDFDVFA